ncbi:MAG: NUDIX hydrolase [Aminipila sp.]
MKKRELDIKVIEDLFKNRKPGVIGRYRYYSVLVPIIKKENQLFLLYEVRSDDLKRQPGEICFPGGAIEENESRRQCAIRETCEELGIRKKHIKVLGELDTLYTYSNFTMYCYLGEIPYEEIYNMKLNKSEVKEIFLVPLDFILENPPFIYNVEVIPNIGADFPYNILKLNNGYNWRKGESEIPIYQFGDRIIWGLTARITHNLANILNAKNRE